MRILYTKHCKKNLSHVFCCPTEIKVNQCFSVLRAYKIFTPCFVVPPKETSEEGAIGGEKDPSMSQEEGKKFVIVRTCVFM